MEIFSSNICGEERTGYQKMEWCVKLMRPRNLSEIPANWGRAVAVLLLLLILVMEVRGEPMRKLSLGMKASSASEVNESEFAAFSLGGEYTGRSFAGPVLPLAAEENAAGTEILSGTIFLPENMTAAADRIPFAGITSDGAAPSDAATDIFPENAGGVVIPSGSIKEESSQNRPDMITGNISEDTSDIMTGENTGNTSDITAEDPAGNTSDITVETPSEDTSDITVNDPADLPSNPASDESEEENESGAGTDIPDADSGSTDEPFAPSPADNGFLIDASGMIYGISAEGLNLEDGCVALPAEGCTGIAAGAFANAPSGILEVFIPANITCIEEGAFTGLYEAEWFDLEPGNPYYSCEDGVLYSENGTCLLAFPAGRSGIYPVPASVTRFAFDAFAGTNIEKLDARKCTLTDLGNLAEGVVVL